MSGRCPYLEAAGLSALDNNEWKAVVREASEALLFPSSFTPPRPRRAKGAQATTAGLQNHKRSAW
jgi:hypothetical protein